MHRTSCLGRAIIVVKLPLKECDIKLMISMKIKTKVKKTRFLSKKTRLHLHDLFFYWYYYEASWYLLLVIKPIFHFCTP